MRERVLSSFPEMPGAPTPAVTTNSVPKRCQVSPVEQNHPWLRTITSLCFLPSAYAYLDSSCLFIPLLPACRPHSTPA